MKIMRTFSILVVLITILCVYSWLVYHVSTGGTKLGFIGKPLLEFSKFPQKSVDIIKSPEVQNRPKTFLTIDTTFIPLNNLTTNLFGLTSFWNNRNNKREVRLFNFKNDAILHIWYFDKKKYKNYNTQYQNCLPFSSLLLKEKQIIINPTPSPNLVRLDSNSNVIWTNRMLEFHHSLNQGADGNLWLCARDLFDENQSFKGFLVKNLDGEVMTMQEDYIVNVDIETGAILLKKGVARILIDNGYKGILYGGNDIYDPIHLNDIQPILEDGMYWKKGDLLLSLRRRSVVLLYRPTTNKILKIIQGPFIGQHDVDIINDKEVSIFNNNYIRSRGFDCKEAYMEVDSLNSSEILIYNFEEDSFRYHKQHIFRKENIATMSQGLSEILSNGNTFVEEQNDGVYYVLDNKEVIMRKVFYTPDSNYIHMPTWIRLYEQLPF